MNRVDSELLLVFILLGSTTVRVVCPLTKNTWSSVTKRFCWSLAERISRQLALSVLRTGSSVAAWMLSWGHAELLGFVQVWHIYGSLCIGVNLCSYQGCLEKNMVGWQRKF